MIACGVWPVSSVTLATNVSCDRNGTTTTISTSTATAMMPRSVSARWKTRLGRFANAHAITIAIVIACAFAILPNRVFHRALTLLGIIAVAVLVLMVVVVPFLSHDTFVANVTELTGQTPQAIIDEVGYPDGGFTFLGFMALCSF